jgi:hypothetical protein
MMPDQLHIIGALVIATQIPLWVKVSFTLFVVGLVPVYWKQYGPINFLWFSDVALLLTIPALWFESSLLASMMTLAVGLLGFAWIADFFLGLIKGASIIGLSSYMFNPRIKRAIRAISLFHLVQPVMLIWMVYRLGYDSRAFLAQTLLASFVLFLSYLLSKPSDNVNWVYGFGGEQRTRPSPLHLVALIVLFPLVIYLPSHFLLKSLFG